MVDQKSAPKPTVLLLGGSQDQLYAIRTAREMGFRTLVVDLNAASPGSSLSDEFHPISTHDIDALKDLCDASRKKGHPIEGVLVMGSDIPHVVAALSSHLGTPGISAETAALATQKYDMKVRFAECDVPIPWFTYVQDVQHLHQIVAEHGFPLIIKPVDRSGARGVFRLAEGCDVEALFRASREFSYSGRVMAESFLEGLQISTETIMWQGKGYTVGFADRNYELMTRYAPNIIENGGMVPTVLDSAKRKAVEQLVEKAALALGIANGVAKGDVVFTDKGPMMIEMAARLSGGDFSESLIPLGCGVNIVEAALTIATGRSLDPTRLEPSFSKAVANRYFFPAPGRLIQVDGVEAVKKMPWLHKFQLWYTPGEMVPPISSHADRFGVFVVTGENIDEVSERVAWVYDRIGIKTEAP